MASRISTANNTITVGINSFRCPCHTCGNRVMRDPVQIGNHIRVSHKALANKLGIGNKPGIPAFICDTCQIYSRRVHYHCFECEYPENGGKSRFFSSKDALNQHLKEDHAKWFFEYSCKFGEECRGKNGGCGFNHRTQAGFITNDQPIPSTVCAFDRPWDGVRCRRDKCSFDHFWGRVRFLIKVRSAPKHQHTEAHQEEALLP